MKYFFNIEIALPRDRVIELYLDSDHLVACQSNIESKVLVSGEHLVVGAKYKLVCLDGKRKTRVNQTTTEIDLPDKIVVLYTYQDTEGVSATSTNRFIDCGKFMRLEVDMNYQGSGVVWMISRLFSRFNHKVEKEMNKSLLEFKIYAEALA